MAGLALVNALRSWAATALKSHESAVGGGLSSVVAFTTPQAELAAFATCGWLLLAMQWTLLYQTRSAHRALMANVQKRSTKSSSNSSNSWSAGFISASSSAAAAAAEVKEEVELSSSQDIRSRSSLTGSSVNSNSMMALFGMDDANDDESPSNKQRGEDHHYVVHETDNKALDTSNGVSAQPTSSGSANVKDTFNGSLVHNSTKLKAADDGDNAHDATHSFLREIVSPSVEEVVQNQERYLKMSLYRQHLYVLTLPMNMHVTVFCSVIYEK